MAKKDIKANLLEHSGVKVRLLGEYLTKYLSVIANLEYNQKIRIYDLFCGNGRYDDGGEGSPIIIAKAIHQLYKSGVIRGQFPQIDCYFNDLDKDKVVNVEKEIGALNLDKNAFGNINYFSNDYQEEVEKLVALLPTIKKEKVFIFIDPYGYKHIRTSDIASLLKNKNAEVLLFLPTQFMYRFDQEGTPESLIDFIEELVQYKDWKETDSIWGFINQLKDAFRDYLGGNFFVDTFTIQKDPRTVFCLFFFSSHIKGFEKMLEAKWQIDNEEGKGWEYDAQPSLFAALKTNPLAEKLKEYLMEGRTNGEVYSFTLHCGFLPKHTNEILMAWQGQGILDVILPDGKPARKKAFYISYDNYRDEPQKVTIKTK